MRASHAAGAEASGHLSPGASARTFATVAPGDTPSSAWTPASSSYRSAAPAGPADPVFISEVPAKARMRLWTVKPGLAKGGA